MLVRLPMIPI